MSAKRVKVLLVDDEPDFVEPVSFWLQSKGYDVVSASNGKDALKQMEGAMPDIVFLDIHMPDMDGLETLRKIRALSKTLPVIMVTATYQVAAHFPKANELGISGFFPKHTSLSELVRIIETSLRAHAKLKPSSGEAAAA